jgi:hypothetical protein
MVVAATLETLRHNVNRVVYYYDFLLFLDVLMTPPASPSGICSYNPLHSKLSGCSLLHSVPRAHSRRKISLYAMYLCQV